MNLPLEVEQACHLAAHQVCNRPPSDRPRPVARHSKQWRFSQWCIVLDAVVVRYYLTAVDAIKAMQFVVDDRVMLVAPNGVKMSAAVARDLLN